MITVDPTVLQLVAATLLPLVVGVMTKTEANPGVKAVVLAAVSAVAAVVGAALEANGLVTAEVVQDAFVNFVVAVATYYGVWKPTNVAQTVQDRTAKVGITVKGT